MTVPGYLPPARRWLIRWLLQDDGRGLEDDEGRPLDPAAVRGMARDLEQARGLKRELAQARRALRAVRVLSRWYRIAPEREHAGADISERLREALEGRE